MKFKPLGARAWVKEVEREQITETGIVLPDTANDRLKRWEFEGRVASDEIRGKYVGRSVADYFTRGAQNPVRYVNC